MSAGSPPSADCAHLLAAPAPVVGHECASDHAHAHAHAHSHHGAADHAHAATTRALRWALGLTAGLFVVELIGGFVSNSLALLADAGHMLTDVGALGRLPVEGDRVTASNAVFTVRAMDGRRIETLAVDLHSVGDRRANTRETA